MQDRDQSLESAKTEQEASGSFHQPRAQKKQSFFWDFFRIFIVAIGIIIPVRLFVFQPFVVTGDSMQPNFQDGDYLIIDELTYSFRPPDRGEVIVLRFPNNPSQFFIKRVVGLPGERIQTEDGQVMIFNEDAPEGVTLEESYLPGNDITFGSTNITLADDEYFVLGDNRLSSSDSRIWGPLQEDFIVGRAYIRAFPIVNFEIFSVPEYGPAQ